MTDDAKSLPSDIEQLKAMLLAERKQFVQPAARLVFLEEQFRIAQQQRLLRAVKGILRKVTCLTKPKQR